MKKVLVMLCAALSLGVFAAVPQAPKGADFVFYVNQSVFRESPTAAKLMDRAIKETHGFKAILDYFKLDKRCSAFFDKPEIKSASCDWWLISASSLNVPKINGKYKLPQIMGFVAGDFDSEKIVELLHEGEDENEREIEGAEVKSYELTDAGIKADDFDDCLNGRLAYGAADLGVVAIGNDKKSLAKAVKLVKGKASAKKNMGELFQKSGNRICSLYVKLTDVDVDLLLENLEIKADPEGALGVSVLMELISEFRAYVILVDEETLKIEYVLTEKPMSLRSEFGKQLSLEGFGKGIVADSHCTMHYTEGKLELTQICTVSEALKAIDDAMMEGNAQDGEDDDDDDDEGDDDDGDED